MNDAQKGIAAAVASNLIWATSPIFWKQLSHVPAMEVLAHRTLWAAVFLCLIISLQSRVVELARLFTQPATLILIALATLMVSANWGLYIWAIQVDRLLDASIGYYIFPLVAVMLGLVFLGERMARMQAVAVGLAAIAVIWLTVSLGVAPWISLTLATSFGIYGLIKKRVPAGPTLSVTAEVALIAPVSLIWLAGVHFAGWVDFTGRAGGLFGSDLSTTLLLIAAGAITAAPLLLFSYASRRVSYATIGVLQYVNPTIQFLTAVWLFGEPVTSAHGIALPLIWLAVIIYSASVLSQERARRRASIAVGTS